MRAPRRCAGSSTVTSKKCSNHASMCHSVECKRKRRSCRSRPPAPTVQCSTSTCRLDGSRTKSPSSNARRSGRRSSNGLLHCFDPPGIRRVWLPIRYGTSAQVNDRQQNTASVDAQDAALSTCPVTQPLTSGFLPSSPVPASSVGLGSVGQVAAYGTEKLSTMLPIDGIWRGPTPKVPGDFAYGRSKGSTALA